MSRIHLEPLQEVPTLEESQKIAPVQEICKTLTSLLLNRDNISPKTEATPLLDTGGYTISKTPNEMALDITLPSTEQSQKFIPIRIARFGMGGDQARLDELRKYSYVYENEGVRDEYVLAQDSTETTPPPTLSETLTNLQSQGISLTELAARVALLE